MATKKDFRGVACGAPVPAGFKKDSDASRPNDWWQWAQEWTNGASAYSREGERLSIGNVPLESVTYYFFENRFIGASILPVKPQPEHAALQKTLLAAFGQPRNVEAISQLDDEARWDGPHMIVRAPGMWVLGMVYSAEFICRSVLEARNQKAERLLAEDERKRLNLRSGDL